MKRTRKTIAAMRAAPPTATGTAMATFLVVLKPPLSLLLDLVLTSLFAGGVGVADATLLGLIPMLDTADGMEEGVTCIAVLRHCPSLGPSPPYRLLSGLVESIPAPATPSAAV